MILLSLSFSLLQFPRSKRTVLFFLYFRSPANNFKANDCSLHQAQSSSHKQQHINSTKLYGTLRQKISTKNRRNFSYAQSFSLPEILRKAEGFQYDILNPFRLIKLMMKSDDTLVPHKSLVPETFRSTKKASSRIFTGGQNNFKIFL